MSEIEFAKRRKIEGLDSRLFKDFKNLGLDLGSLSPDHSFLFTIHEHWQIIDFGRRIFFHQNLKPIGGLYIIRVYVCFYVIFVVLHLYYVHYWPLMASSFIELRKLTLFIKKRYYSKKYYNINKSRKIDNHPALQLREKIEGLGLGQQEIEEQRNIRNYEK